MELVIAWCSFIGAWLLVAGPIYQAALELRDQETQEDRIKSAAANVPKPSKVSAWWWLLPPLKLILEAKRTKKYRKAYMQALHPEDYEALIEFMNKATAWVFIALGALLIAIKETFELTTHYEVSTAAFWIMIFVLFYICILNTVYRIKRSEQAISLKSELAAH